MSVEKYFSVEATSTIDRGGWDVFRTLHVPIKRIELLGTHLGLDTFSLSSDPEDRRRFIHEDQVLHAVLTAEQSQNFLISIRGGPGSGKSHLIRWLEMHLNEDDRFLTIPIRRELSSIPAVLNQIATAAGVESDFGQATPRGSVSELAQWLIASLIPDLEESEKPVAQSSAMAALVHDSVQRFVDSRIQRRLTGADMATPDLDPAQLQIIARRYLPDDGTSVESFVERVADQYKRWWMIREVGQAIDVAEFLTTVGDVVRRQARRPVLLMEDVTSFEVLHRDVINFLTALSSGNFIAVLGWTSAYEHANVQTNVLDRLALRLSLTEESEGGTVEETYSFREPEDLIELVGTYMRAVRVERCSRGCSAGACAAGNRDGLYPFTTTSIRTFYAKLRDQQTRVERRTPRLLLSNVMKPLLDAAVTSKRFPRMESIVAVDPIPLPASYRALGSNYLDWAYTKLWFLGTEAPTSYLDDLGLLVPDPEPEVADDNPQQQAAPIDDQDTVRQASYAAEVRRLQGWLDGGNLPTPDTWLSRVGSLVEVPSVGGLALTTSPRHIRIEGSATGGSSPMAIELARSTDTYDLLQSLARLSVFGSFEERWEGVKVLGRLVSMQRRADRDWRVHLATAFPIFGLLLEVVALAAAFRGALPTDQIFSILPLIAADPADQGAPILPRELLETRRDVEPLAGRISEALRSAHPDQQDTYDVALFHRSLAVYRQNARAGHRLHLTSAIRIGKSQPFTAEELMRADQHIRHLYAKGVVSVETAASQAVKDYRALPPLGTEFVAALQTLREAYARWRDPTRAAMRWTAYQQALSGYQSILTANLGSLEELAENIDSLRFHQTDSVLVRLSRLAAARPAVLRAAVAIGRPAAELVSQVGREVGGSQTTGGAVSKRNRPGIGAELDRVVALIRELS